MQQSSRFSSSVTTTLLLTLSLLLTASCAGGTETPGIGIDSGGGAMDGGDVDGSSEDGGSDDGSPMGDGSSTPPDASAPDAGDRCTGVDCSGEADSCNDSACDPETGMCVTTPRMDGTVCDDANSCTSEDQCSAGVCAGAEVDCSSLADMCNAGVCNPASGTCEPVPLMDGTRCDDASACTTEDQCTMGVCGGSAVDCSALTDMCNAGTCNAMTGACEAVPAMDGTRCDDGSACTAADRCTRGMCRGAVVDCSALTDMCNAGTCNAMTGACEASPVADGTRCDDGTMCTTRDACSAGSCAGTTTDCSALTDMCNVGMCDEASGDCRVMPVADGTRCSDADLCTTPDSCSAGTCEGTPTDCSAVSDQCNVGTCDSRTGGCNPVAVRDGTTCDDGDATTRGDICTAGICAGTAPPPSGAGCNWLLISQETQFDNTNIQGLFTANGHTFDVRTRNGTSGVHSSNRSLIAGYDYIVMQEHDRVLSTTERDILNAFINRGGKLIVTGYDSLGSPTDSVLGGVVGCSSPGDGPFSSRLNVSRVSHPILRGPAASFAAGSTLTAASTDHDRCTPSSGAVRLVDVDSSSSKLQIREGIGASGGAVVYWNGNGVGSGNLEDWTGTDGGSQPQLQNLFVNTLDHLCDRSGHAVLIGHDYFQNEANADRVVGNAALLANTDGNINIVRYTQYSDNTSSGESARTRTAIETTLTAASRTATFTDLSSYTALDLSTADVLLIPEQEMGSAAQLTTVGTAWNSPINSFMDRGGVVIACDFNGSDGDTWRTVTGTGLFNVTGVTSRSGTTTAIAAAASPLAAGVSPYTAPNGSISFAGSFSGAESVITAGGDPVVLHITR